MNQLKIKPPGDDQFIGAYLEKDGGGKEEVVFIGETRSIFCDIPGFKGEKCTVIFYRESDKTYWEVCFHRGNGIQGECREIISEFNTGEAVVSQVYANNECVKNMGHGIGMMGLRPLFKILHEYDNKIQEENEKN